jgi:hypothetical protein
MGSRERKRAERRRRKERTVERYTERSEAKNEEARAALEPLEAGERPLAVTIGAAVSALLFALSLLGYILWPAFRDDARPQVFGVIVFLALMGALAYGMWRARYWAVLGFQVVLVFFILAAARGAALEPSAGAIAGNLVLLAAGGVLFYFMVKAMARIQMPERVPPKE